MPRQKAGESAQVFLVDEQEVFRQGVRISLEQAGFQVLKSSPESYYHSPAKTFSRNICLLVKRVN